VDGLDGGKGEQARRRGCEARKQESVDDQQGSSGGEEDEWWQRRQSWSVYGLDGWELEKGKKLVIGVEEGKESETERSRRKQGQDQQLSQA
jgi:hypothetical protein